MLLRKLRHKLGRAYELRKHCVSERFDEKTKTMLRRAPDIKCMDLVRINDVVKEYEQQIKQLEEACKRDNIDNGKWRMSTNPKSRSSWIAQLLSFSFAS